MKTLIRASAPGKVNLVFEVGALASDGYHPVNSLYLALSLREEITIVKGQTGTGITIYVHGDSIPERHIASVPTDQSNLVHKAVLLFAEHINQPVPDLMVDINKSIPVAGGMAGGSADAAAMLVAINVFMHEQNGTALLSLDELATLGAQLGSDVPFCLYGGLAIGTGRGEIIQELGNFSFETNWVLCTNSQGLSTPLVFQAFDELGVQGSFSDLTEITKVDSLNDLAMLMKNDLQSASISLLPQLEELIAQLEDLGALRAMVSGSGPTIAALFETEAKANEVAAVLRDKGLVALTAKGESAGARLEAK